jgi:hypothetical protein
MTSRTQTDRPGDLDRRGSGALDRRIGFGALLIAVSFHLAIWVYPVDIENHTRYGTILSAIIVVCAIVFFRKRLAFSSSLEKQVYFAFAATYLFSLIVNASSTRALSNGLILVLLSLLMFNEKNGTALLRWLIATSEVALLALLVTFFRDNAADIAGSPLRSVQVSSPFGFGGVLSEQLVATLTLYLAKRRALAIKVPIALAALAAIFHVGIRMDFVAGLLLVSVFIAVAQGLARRGILVLGAAVTIVLAATVIEMPGLTDAENVNREYTTKRSLADSDRPLIWRNYLHYMAEHPRVLVIGGGSELKFEGVGEYAAGPTFVEGYGPHNGYIAMCFRFGVVAAFFFFWLIVLRLGRCSSKYCMAIVCIVLLRNVTQEVFGANQGIPVLFLFAILGADQIRCVSAVAFGRGRDVSLHGQRAS